jgi:iron complex transport system substrate-binding protein
MNRRIFSRALLLAISAVFAFSQSTKQPQRLVSTAPSITELLYALGLGDRIVGVDRFSHYPQEAVTKTQIGDYAAPNLEIIAALKPTLVLIPVNPVQLRQRLEALHLSVLELDQEGLAKMFASFRQVGDATGTSAQAQKLIDSTKQQLDSIRAGASKAKPTKVMFIVGRAPNGLDGLMAVGHASFLNELIEIAGGTNIFNDASAGYVKISLEEVLARNPDVIIDMGDMSDTAKVTEAQKQSVAALWSRMNSIQAVRARRVHAVASDIFVVPGPRVADAANEFFKMLHPELLENSK